MDVYVVINVAMVMLLKNSGLYGKIFVNMCCYRCYGNAVKKCWTLR
jgi:hypothetical protein